jgi:hypothetical protein
LYKGTARELRRGQCSDRVRDDHAGGAAGGAASTRRLLERLSMAGRVHYPTASLRKLDRRYTAESARGTRHHHYFSIEFHRYRSHHEVDASQRL